MAGIFVKNMGLDRKPSPYERVDRAKPGTGVEGTPIDEERGTINGMCVGDDALIVPLVR